MQCATFVSGADEAEDYASLTRCQNWGAVHGFPPMEGFTGPAGFLRLIERVGTSAGGIQAVVVHRLAEVPDLVWLMKALHDNSVFLVAVADEVDTTPFTMCGAGQGRFLAAVAGWAAAADAAYEAEESVEATVAAPAVPGVSTEPAALQAAATASFEPLAHDWLELRQITVRELRQLRWAKGNIAVDYLPEWVAAKCGVSLKQSAAWIQEHP